MNAIVTILRSELKEKPHLLSNLVIVCPNTEEDEDVFIVKPSPGTLFEVLNFLKENKIKYAAHFDTFPPV